VLRLTLTLLALAAIGAAGYHAWNLQRQIDEADASASTFADARVSAVRAAFDLRSAQQAYVAAGQNKDFWFQKVNAATAAIRSSIHSLEQATSSGTARAALTEAAGSLDEFEEQDRRVRTYASSGQDLLAADVIFSDARDSITRILAALDLAADGAVRERTEALDVMRREQMIAAGGAAAVAVLALLILAPLPKVIANPDSSSAPAEASSRKTLDLDLRPTPRYVVTQPVAPRATQAPPEKKAQERPEPAPAREPVPPARVRLEELARVCSDLARLSDTSSIPGILERTATALDAVGLVLWVADADGKVLTPIAAHGYPASVVSRMGALPVDGQNATAAAFRTGLVQTVRAGASANGAIAAPLVAPGGPLGVMSAEVRADGGKQDERLAAASIVAAQLATIIGVPAPQDEKAAR
jgi:hypothetical protein